MQAFKGFDLELKCRDFQYEIGKTYKHDGTVKACAAGFHACENPFDVWQYYPPTKSRFATVEQSGALAKHNEDSKIASAEITIKAELTLPEFITSAVNWIVSRSKKSATTGECANAATTGSGANAATTGECANAATTGYRANAATTGSGANAATTGYRANAATTGECANAATTGSGANAATTGECANAATKGKNSIACSLGRNSSAQAEQGGFIILVQYDDDGNPKSSFFSAVGKNKIKAGVSYRLNKKGEPVAVSE